MPSEAAAWCGGVLGAACTGESRCSGRGFVCGIVGLCGDSARHVERAVAGVFSVRARARRVRRVSGGSGVVLWPVAPRRGSCFPCVVAYMMLMLGGLGWRCTRARGDYGPGDPRAVRRAVPRGRGRAVRFLFVKSLVKSMPTTRSVRPGSQTKQSAEVRTCGRVLCFHYLRTSAAESRCALAITHLHVPRCSRRVSRRVSVPARPPVAL